MSDIWKQFILDLRHCHRGPLLLPTELIEAELLIYLEDLELLFSGLAVPHLGTIPSSW